jgi:hypothetical protein
MVPFVDDDASGWVNPVCVRARVHVWPVSGRKRSVKRFIRQSLAKLRGFKPRGVAFLGAELRALEEPAEVLFSEWKNETRVRLPVPVFEPVTENAKTYREIRKDRPLFLQNPIERTRQLEKTFPGTR